MILTLLIVFLLGCIGSLYYQQTTNKQSIPNLFGYKILNVVTASMEPTIKMGDSILIKSTNEVNVKDIITFRQGNSYVTHRVVYKEGDQFITRGDNNSGDDKAIKTIKDVEGKYVRSLPSFLRLSSFLKTREGVIAIIGIPVLLILILAMLGTRNKEQ
ncbi:signal peptidase I [Treponema sp. R6D11]